MTSSTCSCSRKAYHLVFACSGAADVGEIADQTARRLSKEKPASFCCTAAIGAQDEDILEITRNADRVLAIDGCSKNCSRVILEKAGFLNIRHLQLESLGMKKKESPCCEERLHTALKHARLTLFNL